SDNQTITSPATRLSNPVGLLHGAAATTHHKAPHKPMGVQRTPILRSPVRCSEAEACGVKKQHMMGVPKGTPSEETQATPFYPAAAPWSSPTI
ncbi:MAG: hypothetical protein HDS88_06765, partial [Bacteroidales bacterium]|nr:hypothetical protein [Bacteroidales bacterium]